MSNGDQRDAEPASPPDLDDAMLDELHAFAEADATALEELGAVLDALRARAVAFAGPEDPDGSGRFDIDAIWAHVEAQLDSRPER